jgi:peptidoglycan/LPS O-acetylase OafA/YrhL
MLGTWRFLLAALVALSHDGVLIAGLNPGVMAVVGFYLISGYVMTGLLRKHYSRLNRVPAFYADRALRLLPAYFTLMALTAAWWALAQEETAFLKLVPESLDWLNNLLIVPLNYYMVNGSDAFTLIPPAWSLGAEVQFYLLIPFILMIAPARTALLLLALGVQLAAAGGFVNADWFGYRLLPGALLFFLLGSWLFDHHRRGDEYRPMRMQRHLLLLFLVGVWGLLLAYNGRWGVPYLAETAIGLLVGLVLLDRLALRRRRGWDEYLGHLSYGLFLGHFLIIWALPGRPEGLVGHVLLLAAATALAAAVYGLVERPALQLRHRWRWRKKPNRGDSTNPVC